MIRIAKKQDIIQINNLGSLLIFNFSSTYNLNDYISNDKYIILVNEDESINAFLIAFKNYDFYELEAIYVDEKFRNRKIASNLLTYFIENYLKLGDNIYLEVAVNNNKAINLYKKFDFKITNVRKNYYKCIDAYIMKR